MCLIWFESWNLLFCNCLVPISWFWCDLIKEPMFRVWFKVFIRLQLVWILLSRVWSFFSRTCFGSKLLDLLQFTSFDFCWYRLHIACVWNLVIMKFEGSIVVNVLDSSCYVIYQWSLVYWNSMLGSLFHGILEFVLLCNSLQVLGLLEFCVREFVPWGLQRIRPATAELLLKRSFKCLYFRIQKDQMRYRK